MRARRLGTTIVWLSWVVVFSQVTIAQARVSSEPPEPSLLNLTRQWSRASILGDLRALKTGSDYLELRVWSGFGLTVATDVVVVRRAAGQWSAFLGRVLRCEIEIPRSVGDTASRATMQGYVAEARRHCGVSVKDVSAGAQLITTDSLIVNRLTSADSVIESAWAVAARAGVSELPARVERHGTLDDDFTYVVELRRGTDYRASEVERLEQPQTDADRKVKDIYDTIRRVLPPDVA